jgi:hypothetical protein
MSDKDFLMNSSFITLTFVMTIPCGGDSLLISIPPLVLQAGCVTHPLLIPTKCTYMVDTLPRYFIEEHRERKRKRKGGGRNRHKEGKRQRGDTLLITQNSLLLSISIP